MRLFRFCLILLLVSCASASAQGDVPIPTREEQIQEGKDLAFQSVTGATLTTVFISTSSALITYFLAIVTAFSVLYFGSWTKRVLNQVLNTMACISPLILLLVIYTSRDYQGLILIIFLGLAIYPLIGRQVLGRVSEAAEEFQFMQAKVLGHSPVGVFLDYAWPKFLPLTLPFFFFGFIYSLLMESMFSSLGFFTLSDYPTWGGLIHLGEDQMMDAPWQVFYSGGAIIISSLVAYICIPIFDRLLSIPKKA